MTSTDELFRRYAARRAAMGIPLTPNREFTHENQIIREENQKAGVKPKERVRTPLNPRANQGDYGNKESDN